LDKLLFLGKVNDHYVDEAIDFCHNHFNATVILGDWGDPLPPSAYQWRGEYIISYLSRWIVPADILGRAGKAALNFHPAPPEYPGFGPVNWALYTGAREYGVTCHHMAARVDSGDIVDTMAVAIRPDDTVASLLDRAHVHQLGMFYYIMRLITIGRDLPRSDKKWNSNKRTRRDLDKLATLTPGMPEQEMQRRIRATSYGSWQPKIKICGREYRLSNGN